SLDPSSLHDALPIFRFGRRLECQGLSLRPLSFELWIRPTQKLKPESHNYATHRLHTAQLPAPLADVYPERDSSIGAARAEPAPVRDHQPARADRAGAGGRCPRAGGIS